MIDEKQFEGKTVWIVDGEHSPLIEALALRGATVRDFREPFSAVEAIKSATPDEAPDLVVTELRFRSDGDWRSSEAIAAKEKSEEWNMLGERVIDAMNQNSATRNTPIIVLTADQKARFKSFRNEVSVLVKPEEVKKLVDAVERKINPQIEIE